MPTEAPTNAEYHRKRRAEKKAEWERLKAADAAAKKASDSAEVLKSVRAIEKNSNDIAGLLFTALEHMTNDLKLILHRIEQHTKPAQTAPTKEDAK